MWRAIAIALPILVAAPALANGPNRALEFARAYVRALSETESIRADSERDLKTAGGTQEQFSECIHSTQLQIYAMADAANTAATFRLPAPSKETPSLVVKYFADKGRMYASLSDMCQTVLEGPKPGVDYGKIAVDMPKLRADMEHLDKMLFPLAVSVFAALIDPKPDKQGHMSRLVLTRQERDDLVHQISISFKNLDAKNANYTVSSAAILRDYLARKGYHCADDPA